MQRISLEILRQQLEEKLGASVPIGGNGLDAQPAYGRREREEEHAPAADRLPQPWRGRVNELFSGEPGATIWHPPVTLAIHWMRCAFGGDAHDVNDGRLALWIGRDIWPYPPVLAAEPDALQDTNNDGLTEPSSRNSLNRHIARSPDPQISTLHHQAARSPNHQTSHLLHRSLFIDSSKWQERLWAAELGLRSPAVGALAVDGRGFSMAATRRLQLAAAASCTLMLLLRAPHELAIPSAAGVRWRVRHVPSPVPAPRWSVELLRCKGVQPTGSTASENPEDRESFRGRGRWIMEGDCATGALHLPADVERRSDQTASAETIAARSG